VRLVKKYKAHDENNECREGDHVEIIESKPMSRHKRWSVVSVLERAE
jgi:small subunit ribosomal protein S17